MVTNILITTNTPSVANIRSHSYICTDSYISIFISIFVAVENFFLSFFLLVYNSKHNGNQYVRQTTYHI
jgi:hypothetical protein